MKTIEIKGTLRNELGKKNSRLIRKEGNVPCVIYGKEQNIHFQAHENSFKNLVYTHEAHLVRINLEGKEIKAVLQDIQFHSVSDKILHADFVGDQEHRQERDGRGQPQTVDEHDERRLLEVPQLGRLDLAVDLGQRLLAAHRQDRVPESDQDAEKADLPHPVSAVQPPECVL